MEILHITPHLGGGVGKAVSGIIAASASAGCGARHEVICLEVPENQQFVNLARAAGCKVSVAQSTDQMSAAVDAADIVQLEFWNHPATLGWLCSASLPAMRLLVWCHVSGLYFPRFPSPFLECGSKFLFTSLCSYEAVEVGGLSEDSLENFGVVSSGGGLESLPPPRPSAPGEEVRFGYVGNHGFAKLHPDFVSSLAEVSIPGFCVDMVGDGDDGDELERQCKRLGRPELINRRGYKNDIGAVVGEFDVLVYLLNPAHYGTAENALLEAMAMGVAPIVLNNPAERCIVKDGVTGFVIDSPSELGPVVKWISEHRGELSAIQRTAAAVVRDRYSFENSWHEMEGHYIEMAAVRKRQYDFRRIFGSKPADWFRSFVRDPAAFDSDGGVDVPSNNFSICYRDRRKGSVYHFLDHYPDDPRLQAWAGELESRG